MSHTSRASWSKAGRIAFFLGVLAATADRGFAQGVGLRGGVGVIAKGYIGAHVDARLDRSEGSQNTSHKVRELWFRPSFELMTGNGPGDDWLPRSMINLEFRVQRSIGSRWSRYAGTGMTISHYHARDRYGYPWHDAGWRKGVTLVTGIASQRGTFIEAKIDPTLLKFGMGYTFGRK